VVKWIEEIKPIISVVSDRSGLGLELSYEGISGTIGDGISVQYLHQLDTHELDHRRMMHLYTRSSPWLSSGRDHSRHHWSSLVVIWS
jgi:hypothetical protein